MSFSGAVKEELARQMPSSRHCQIAELASMLQYGDAFEKTENAQGVALQIKLQGENLSLFRKCNTLLIQTLHIRPGISGLTAASMLALEEKDMSSFFEEDKETDNVRQMHTMIIDEMQSIKQLCDVFKISNELFTDNPGSQADTTAYMRTRTVNPLLIKNVCCKRAFLRGAFLAIGSMSNPEKGYHLEYVCQNEEQAYQLQGVISSFDVEARIIARKKYQVVYVKEGEGIVELLNIMGAHVSLMNFENLRILKEMRNDINRKVNCEAANITKTVNASTKQIEDISYIRDHYGFSRLSDTLREMAEVRLDYPDATLKELGEYLNPVVGKSGVNHRLRKLSELAEKLRTE